MNEVDQEDEFEFWLGAYRDDPNVSIIEATRLLKVMCEEGNGYALRFHADHPDPESWRCSPEDIDEQGEAEIAIDTYDDRTEGHRSPPVVIEINDYSPGWPQIAHALKDARQWRCEICKFTLSGSGLLQVHHINGDKADNQSANLQVLCAMCHGNKHGGKTLWPYGFTEGEKRQLYAHHSNFEREQRRLRLLNHRR